MTGHLRAPEPRTTAPVLGYPVARITLDDAVAWGLEAMRGSAGVRLLVTLNPEIVVRAQRDPALQEALHHADLTVADGVGIVWAARRSGQALPERVPGVELITALLAQGGSSLKVYFLGGEPGVAEAAAAAAQARFGTMVMGTQHGYFKRPKETTEVVRTIASSGAQLLLAGLGEGQELFLHTHRDALTVPLLIGVGGTLDVLAGRVKRTPAWTHKLGLEWAYRVGLDPGRWHRFPRLLEFVRLVLTNSHPEHYSGKL